MSEKNNQLSHDYCNGYELSKVSSDQYRFLCMLKDLFLQCNLQVKITSSVIERIYSDVETESGGVLYIQSEHISNAFNGKGEQINRIAFYFSYQDETPIRILAQKYNYYLLPNSEINGFYYIVTKYH